MQQLDLGIITITSVDLPTILRLQERQIISWAPVGHIEPDLVMLSKLHKGPRSRTGKKQSEMSKRRQNFISGVNRQHLGIDERTARRLYQEEWLLRVGHD